MAYELKAVLSLEDKFTERMKAASRAVEKFASAARKASTETNSLANAQRKLLNGNTIKNAVSQNKMLGKSVQDTSKAVKQSTSDVSDLVRMYTMQQAAQTEMLKSNNDLRRSHMETKNSQVMADKYYAQQDKFMKSSMQSMLINHVQDMEKINQKHNNTVEQMDKRSKDALVRDENKANQQIRTLRERSALDHTKHLDYMEKENARYSRNMDVENSKRLRETERFSNANALMDRRDAIRREQRAYSEEKASQRIIAARRKEQMANRVSAFRGMAQTGSNVVRNTAVYGGMVAGAGVYMGARAGLNGINTAMNYEQLLANIRALADTSEKSKLKLGGVYDKKFKEMASNSIYKPDEILEAARVQVKAGSSLPSIMNGELQTALNLAQAADWAPQNAAEFMAQAKSAFSKTIGKDAKMSGKDVNKYIADAVAGASNYTILDPVDFAQAIQMGGGISGMKFDQFVKFTAGMSKFGGQMGGSDIGTSIKTFTNFITNPTKPARKMMEQYGFMKNGQNQFYDKNGKLKDFDSMANLVYSKTNKLNDQKRSELFFGMGGSDAARALKALYEGGANKKELANLSKALRDTDVNKIAAERNSTTQAKWKKLQSTWETTKIDFFVAALEPLATTFGDIRVNLLKNKDKIAAAGLQFVEDIKTLGDKLFNDPKWKEVKTGNMLDKIFTAINILIDNFAKWLKTSKAGKEFVDNINKMIKEAVTTVFHAVVEAIKVEVPKLVSDAWKEVKTGGKDKKTDWGNLAIGTGITAVIAAPLIGALAGFINGATKLVFGKNFLDLFKKPPKGYTNLNDDTKINKGGKGGKGGTVKETTKTKVVKEPKAPKIPTDGKTSKVIKSIVDSKYGKFGKFAGGFAALEGLGVVLSLYDTTMETIKDYNNIKNHGDILYDVKNNRNKADKGELDMNWYDWIFNADKAVPALESKWDKTSTPEKTKGFALGGAGIIGQLYEKATQSVKSYQEKSDKQATEFLAGVNAQASTPIGISSGDAYMGQLKLAIASRDNRIATSYSSMAANYVNTAPIPNATVPTTKNTNPNFGSLGGLFGLGLGLIPHKAGGEHRVGADGYRYVHKDEAILSRGDARGYRNGTMGGNSVVIQQLAGEISVRHDGDIDALAKSLAREIILAGGNM